MKKIVVINSSLKGRASSTLNVTNAFLEGFKLIDEEAQIEVFHLAELTIHYCIDCESCTKNSNSVCHFADDMSLMLEKYQAADLVIHSFSLNNNGLPSLLQKYIERMRPLRTYLIDDELGDNISIKSIYNRPEDSKFIIISTCRSTNIEASYQAANIRIEQNFDGKATTLLFPSTTYPYVNKTISGINFFKALQWAGQDFARDGKISEPVYEILHRFCPSTKQDIVIPVEFAMQHYQFDLDYKKLNLIALGKLCPLKETYRPPKIKHTNKILGIEFSDILESYQLILKEDQLEVIPNGSDKPQGQLHTSYDVFSELLYGKTDIISEMKRGVLTYEGDIDILKALNNGMLYTPNKKDEELSLLLSSGLNNDWTKQSLNQPIYSLIPWIIVAVFMFINIGLGLPIALFVSLILVLAKRRGDITLLDKANVLTFLITNALVVVLAHLYTVEGNEINRMLSLILSFFYGVSLLTKVPLTAYIGYPQYKNTLGNLDSYVKKHQIMTFILTNLFMLVPIIEIVALWVNRQYLSPYIIPITILTVIGLKYMSLNYDRWVYLHLSRKRSNN